MTKTIVKYRRTVKTIPDKPLYRTIAEYIGLGILVGAVGTAIYYKQKEFNESIKRPVLESTNHVNNLEGKVE